jgi:hypothetical protein
MNNFTLQNKLDLQVIVEAGAQVVTVAYNPNTLTGTNPETAAIADGWTQFYREATLNLVEAIYTK